MARRTKPDLLIGVFDAVAAGGLAGASMWSTISAHDADAGLSTEEGSATEGGKTEGFRDSDGTGADET